MTKADIVREIATQTGLEKQVVLQVVEGFMDSVKSSMINGEEVYLRGFGSFIIKHRAEKTARNISRNTTVIVPAHNIPAFKPSKAFAGRIICNRSVIQMILLLYTGQRGWHCPIGTGNGRCLKGIRGWCCH